MCPKSDGTESTWYSKYLLSPKHPPEKSICKTHVIAASVRLNVALPNVEA